MTPSPLAEAAVLDSTRRREWLAILAFTLVGAVVRLAGLNRSGLTHFDEGIYALAGGWVFQDGGISAIDPGLIAYAPPFFVLLVGVAYRLLGVSDTSSILVSIVAGIAALPMVGLLARRIFGPGAGAAATGFAAVSVPHVVFSRMALTDSTFLLTWLIALEMGRAFLERPTWLRACGLGLAVGLAQLTKYNGWLTGGIVVVSAAFDLLRDPESRKRWQVARTFGFGSLAALIALLVDLPWIRFVERHGGYASLLEHQRSYLGTASSWPRHLLLQLDQMVALSGGRYWQLAGLACALAGVAFVVRRPRTSNLGSLVAVHVIVVAAFAPNLNALCVALAIPILLASGSRSRRFLGVACLIPVILTPFYHPYARLWLPVEGLGWIVLGGAVATLWTEQLDILRSRRKWLALIGGGIVFCVSLWLTSGRAKPALPFPDVLGPTDSLRLAVPLLAKAIPAEVSSVLVLARPPVLFYLSGRINAQRVADEEALRAPDLSRSWAVVDEALAPEDATTPPGQYPLRRIRNTASSQYNWMGPATRLDADHSATALGRPPPRLRLWLLRSYVQPRERLSP